MSGSANNKGSLTPIVAAKPETLNDDADNNADTKRSNSNL